MGKITYESTINYRYLKNKSKMWLFDYISMIKSYLPEDKYLSDENYTKEDLISYVLDIQKYLPKD